MKIFIGCDPRQYIAFQVLTHSIWKNASKPVSITRLDKQQLPDVDPTQRGLTEFTYTRYLVPYLCGYKGQALFLDADMLCLGDIHEIPKYVNTHAPHAISVVKGEERFEWPSLMYFRNKKCKNLTPEYIRSGKPMTFDWAESVGELPAEWNHIVPYDGINPNAKLVHFTQGIPCFPETRGCEYTGEWQEYLDSATSTVPWKDIMGTSVHKQRMSL